MINRFKKKAVTLWQIPKSARIPKRVEYLIYDNEGADKICSCLVKSESVDIIHIRNEEISIACLLLIPIMMRYEQVGKTRFTTLAFNAYIDGWIHLCKPSVIITFIDNDPRFYTIKSRWEHFGVKTIAIQNGVRSFYLIKNSFTSFTKANHAIHLSCDLIAVLNSKASNMYKHFIKTDFFMHGSLINNSTLSHVATSERGAHILFISQFRRSLAESPLFDYERKLLPTLKEWCVINNYGLSILGCANEKELVISENNFYRTILGNNTYKFTKKADNFIEQYQSLDKASIVVSIDSTLGLEAIARGCKTAFFYGKTSSKNTLRESSEELNFLNSVGIAFDLDQASKQFIKTQLDTLKMQSSKEWTSRVASCASEVMYTDYKSERLFEKIKRLMAPSKGNQ